MSTSRDLSAGGQLPSVACLINGQPTVGKGPPRQIINPASGAPVTELRDASDTQVAEAIEAAKVAQRTWARQPIALRAALIHKGTDRILEHVPEIARAVSIEMGKKLSEARHEIEAVCAWMHQSAEDALRLLGTVGESRFTEYPSRRVITLHQPIGVAAMISPWNFPVEMIGNAVAALLMGNAVVWKPSELAPTGPSLITKHFLEGELPVGLLNLVYGGAAVGQQLVEHPDVGVIGFIGSTVTGERIARAAGVKRLLLELGGNGPMIVMEDANIDAAVEGAVAGCFYMAGQVCIASERILVHERVHDEFVDKLTRRAAALKVGDPLDESTDMGPLSSDAQLKKVTKHVADALAKGARVTTGGTNSGRYYAPTVLTNVRPGMEIADEETFGPVAPVIRFASMEEAIEIANDSPYGLQASVYTSSLYTAWTMGEQLETGNVIINAGNMAGELGAPFGGVKKSGIGRAVGPDGLRTFSNVKHISMNLQP